VKAFVEADARRVSCPTHGVVVEHVPWARAHSRFTRVFEETVAWLTCRTDKSSVSELFDIAWRTVGAIMERVAAGAPPLSKRLENVRRIGIDEVSYRRGHRYLTVIVDHDTGHLLFAHTGKDEAALAAFFDAAGDDICNQLKLISMDASPSFRAVVERRCPNATICTDPFHVVKWANDALDAVRRRLWNAARKSGRPEAKVVKGARYALLKNPSSLSERQQASLAGVEKCNKSLYRAYLIKEHLRLAFNLRGDIGKGILAVVVRWAKRSRIPEFKALAASISNNLTGIQAALTHGLTNAVVEGLNTRMQLLTRMSFGYHSAGPLISHAMLKIGGLCPPLPSLKTHRNVT
jgi:transposase